MSFIWATVWIYCMGACTTRTLLRLLPFSESFRNNFSVIWDFLFHDFIGIQILSIPIWAPDLTVFILPYPSSIKCKIHRYFPRNPELGLNYISKFHRQKFWKHRFDRRIHPWKDYTIIWFWIILIWTTCSFPMFWIVENDTIVLLY